MAIERNPRSQDSIPSTLIRTRIISDRLHSSPLYIRKVTQELGINIITKAGMSYIDASDYLTISEHINQQKQAKAEFSGLISQMPEPETATIPSQNNKIDTNGVYKGSYLDQQREVVIFEPHKSEREEKTPKVIPADLIDTKTAMEIAGVKAPPTFAKLRMDYSIDYQRIGKKKYYSEIQIREMTQKRKVDKAQRKITLNRAKIPAPVSIPEGQISTDEVAKLLGMTETSFYNHAKFGLQSIRIGHKAYYSREEVLKIKGERQKTAQSREIQKQNVGQEKERRLKKTSPTPTVKPELPENYISTDDAAILIGTSLSGFYSNKRFGLNPVRRGHTVYYDRTEVERVREERRIKLEKQKEELAKKALPEPPRNPYVRKAASRKLQMRAGKIRQSRTELKQPNTIPQGHINTQSVLEILGISKVTLDNLRKSSQINVIKIGNFNYYPREVIEKIKEERIKHKQDKKKATTVDKFLQTHQEQDISSFQRFLAEARNKNILTPKQQLHMGAKIFAAKLAVEGAGMLFSSNLLNTQQLQRLETLLTNPTVGFLATNAKGDKMLDNQTRVRGKTLKDLAHDYVKYLEDRLNEARDSGDPQIIQHLTNRTIAMIENGRQAVLTLVETNIRLGLRPTRGYSNISHMSQEELMSYSNEGLMIAAVKYDFRLGFRFSTYAMNWIKQRISRGIDYDDQLIRVPVHIAQASRKISRQREKEEGTTLAQTGRPALKDSIRQALRVRNVVSLDAPITYNGRSGPEDAHTLGDIIADKNDTLTEKINNSDLEQRMNILLAELNMREANILRMRFGIGDGQPRTLEEIGKIMGITRERVRQIETRAIRNIKRNPAKLEQLREFIV